MNAGRIATLRIDLMHATSKLDQALNWRAGYELQARSLRMQANQEADLQKRTALLRAEIHRRGMAQQLTPVIQVRRTTVGRIQEELAAAQSEPDALIPLPSNWAHQCADMDETAGASA